MGTYAIRRLQAWGSPAEVEHAAARSEQVADSDSPDDIGWIRSCVIAEADRTPGSVSIYQASDPDTIRKHAQRAGMPADETWNVADLVVIRPDPAQLIRVPLRRASGRSASPRCQGEATRDPVGVRRCCVREPRTSG